MNALVPVAPPRPIVEQTMGFNGCKNCKLYKQCGGHPEPVWFAAGCANYTGGKPATDTDDMNPNFEAKFWHLWDDVAGLVDYTVGPLRSMNAGALPRYVPQLQGRHLRPSRPLDAKVVALHLFQVVCRRPGGAYAVKYETADQLRAAYGLGPKTRVILVGVDNDAPLEWFWRKHRSHEIGSALARLAFEVTIPNYSFFTCVPRFQILRNRKRILLVAERLSQAGVRVAIHLSALTPADWAFWLAFLREHTEVSTITLEFQTGPLADQALGQQVFDALDDLIDRVGRPIHIIMVGAARFYAQARQRRWNFTVIDSVPFMYTKSRKLLQRDAGGTFSLTHYPTRPDAPLHQLFEANVQAYEKWLSTGSETPREPLPDNPKQIPFLW